MSRYVANAGAFYSYLAHGLGPDVGRRRRLRRARLLQRHPDRPLRPVRRRVRRLRRRPRPGVDLPWWVWAARRARRRRPARACCRVDLNANVLAVLLVLEMHRGGALRHRRVRPPRPAAAWSPPRFLPSALFVPGVGMVFAFGIAAFIGFESGAIYSEECRNPRVTVARATFIAVVFTGALLLGVGVGDAADGRCLTTSRLQPRRTGPGWCSGRWPSTGARRRRHRQRAVPDQRLRRASELPQRRGALPVRAGP